MASRRRGAAILSVAAVCVVVAASCGAQGNLRATPSTVLVSEVVTTVTRAEHAQGGVAAPEAPPMPEPSPPTEMPAGQGLDRLVAGLPGSIGVAVTPVGGATVPVTAGSWQSGVAWSTIKIPLAIAVEQSASGALDGATSAITSSDNDAAERLWTSLGGSTSSSSAVQSVLAQAGDETTLVPSTVTRPPYSVFGQTRWSLVDQARFGALLPCLGGSGRVVDLMRQISPDQSWGLGQISGARFKGGWGPGESGGYLVRQFGIVPAVGGDVAVAIGVDAPSFEAGTATLSQLADSLAPALAATPGGSC